MGIKTFILILLLSTNLHSSELEVNYFGRQIKLKPHPSKVLRMKKISRQAEKKRNFKMSSQRYQPIIGEQFIVKQPNTRQLNRAKQELEVPVYVAAGHSEIAPSGQLALQFKSGVTDEQIEQLFKQHNLELEEIQEHHNVSYYIVLIDDPNRVFEIGSQLNNAPLVQDASALFWQRYKTRSNLGEDLLKLKTTVER
jgi:hypothetical protein